MPDIRTGYGCPSCERTTGEINEIIARDGRGFFCSKVPEHNWADSDALGSLEPKMRFQQQQERPAAQAHHTNINVSLPVAVYNVVLEKYGDKLNATLAGALSIMAEGEGMVISETDAQRLQMLMPEKIKSGSHLVGLIFAMQQQLQEANQEKQNAVEQANAYAGMTPGTVVVTLGQHYAYCVDRAKEESLPVKVWLDQKLKNALDNTWL